MLVDVRTLDYQIILYSSTRSIVLHFLQWNRRSELIIKSALALDLTSQDNVTEIFTHSSWGISSVILN